MPWAVGAISTGTNVGLVVAEISAVTAMGPTTTEMAPTGVITAAPPTAVVTMSRAG